MSAVVIVTRVGAAHAATAAAAAAAVACAASEPDRAALLVELGDDRVPRPTPIATAGARELEERLAAHLPQASVASRGQFCQLTLAAAHDSFEPLAAALPLTRESAGVVHCPPELLRPLLAEPRIRPTAALLRADLAADRALTALAARDLMARGLRVAVLKQPLGWLASRAALLGALPAVAIPKPAVTPVSRLLRAEDNKLQQCYDGKDGSEDGQEQDHADRSRP